MPETKARHIANLVEDDGDVKSAHLDNVDALPTQTSHSGKFLTTDGSSASWGTVSVTPTAVSDKTNDSTGYLDLPSGTTAQRPTLNNAGGTRFNTTSGSLEFYDGNNWVSTNLIPSINSITGDIIVTHETTLTLSVTNATDTIDVKYYESGTLLGTDQNRTVNNNSVTSTVPSAVFNQTAGDTISIQVFNQDGTPSSNSINKTVVALPSGGTKTGPTGGYYYHTFNSSDATGFTNTITNLSVEFLLVAGGGAGGYIYGGGGGAGGCIDGTATLAVGNTAYVQGAGGTSVSGAHQTSENGGDSTWNGNTAYGGGCGGKYDTNANNGVASSRGRDGGSGGGGAAKSGGGQGGNGTTNQGNAGGSLNGTVYDGYWSAGGGGAGSAGTSATHTQSSANGTAGGDGIDWKSLGTYYGGGGGGAGFQGGSGGEAGGSGGGGRGGDYSNQSATNGSQNTGGGGGAGSDGSWIGGGQGGSGKLIIRYQLP